MNEELIRLFNEVLFPVMLPCARMLAALSIVPIFGSNSMPMMVRVGFVLSLAIFLHPASVALVPHETFGPLFWAVILVKEVVIGVFLGFLYSLYVMALEAIGSLVDTVIGNNNLFLFNPALNQQAGPYSSLFSMFGTLYFIASGGLLLMVGGFYASFAAWPVLSYAPHWSKTSRAFLLARFADMLVVTLQMAMPLLIGLMIVDIALGLLNRKASEIQVFVLSMPIKAAVAMGSLILVLTFMSDSASPLRRLLGAAAHFVRRSP